MGTFILVNRSALMQIGFLVLLLTFATARCGSRRAAEDTSPQAEWSLTVTNRHSLDVSVYVISDGQRTRVGVVPAAGDATYILPSRLVGAGRTVRLEANAIGSPARLTTDGLLVHPGQHVRWTLQNGLGVSNVAVW